MREAKKVAGPELARGSANENQSQLSQDARTMTNLVDVRMFGEATKHNSKLRQVVRKAAVLADLCTGEDLETDARVIREACDATHRVFDIEAKHTVMVPDHKTRLAATTLRRAYVEGTPVKREVKIIQDFRSTDDVLADFRQSPEGMRTLRALSGLGAGMEIDGEIVPPEDIQETGGEK